jgi:hypothetical protein
MGCASSGTGPGFAASDSQHCIQEQRRFTGKPGKNAGHEHHRRCSLPAPLGEHGIQQPLAGFTQAAPKRGISLSALESGGMPGTQ